MNTSFTLALPGVTTCSGASKLKDILECEMCIQYVYWTNEYTTIPRCTSKGSTISHLGGGMVRIGKKMFGDVLVPMDPI